MNLPKLIRGATVAALTLASLLPSRAHAQALKAGDVAVIAVNTDNPDQWGWVPLVDLPAFTTLKFTDSSFGSGGTNYFRWTEGFDTQGPLTWSNSAPVARGTVIRWDGSGAWSTGFANTNSPQISLSTSSGGDQLFVYTGTIVSNAPAGYTPYVGDPSGATMLYGINFANTSGWLTSGGGSTGASYLPTVSAGAQLSAASNTAPALVTGSRDDFYYSGPTRGTRSQLLASLAVTNNWQYNANSFSTGLWATAFQVFDGYQNTLAGTTISNMAASSTVGKLTQMKILNSDPLSSNSEVTASFTATNVFGFKSDVLHFGGAGTNTFVLQLTYDSTGLTLAQEQQIYIAWLNTNNNQWVNAVFGNVGGTTNFVLGAWNPSYGLGSFGVDAPNDTVWAVVNHNSDFAAVPEPAAAWLLGLTTLGFLLCRRGTPAR